ncbi:mobile mystery protein A [Neolewinella persica]|uniref:mobile mystery protein A n=1 Tax=Neolewinella persica TaxID=70998 RepID=UPI00036FA90A|nr:mobile mystery protein A [Neolewinella persica]
MSNKLLVLRVISEKLNQYASLRSVVPPDVGWISSIRQSLNMTMEQLGRKLKVTKQAVSQIEKRESEGTLTLNGLRDAANAMDMQLIYAIVPKTGTLETYVEQRAFELARETLLEVNQQMRLEAQAVDDEQLSAVIAEAAAELVRSVDRQLWD